jgi:hypothetical protein
MPKFSRKIEIPLWIIAFAAIVIAGATVFTEDEIGRASCRERV